jgi:hypothetical protein
VAVACANTVVAIASSAVPAFLSNVLILLCHVGAIIEQPILDNTARKLLSLAATDV